MNKKVLNTLEYDKIVEQLAKLAGSDGGKKLCRSLTPMTDRDEILEAQRETSDALTHIMTQGPISFQGVTPIKESLKRLELGAPLSMRELLDISSLLACAGQTKHYFRKSLNENEETGDCLNERYQLLEPLAPLMQEIRRCIIAEDEMADDAAN